MFIKQLRIAYGPEDDSGGGGDPGGGSDQSQSADETAAHIAALQARLAETEKTTQALQDEKDAAAAKEAAEAKAKADADKVKAGETKQLLDEKNARIAELEAKHNEFIERETKRVEAKVAALPDTIQKEIALVRDALDLPKLEEYVNMRAESAKVAAPAPNVPGGSAAGDGEPEIDKTAGYLLGRANADPATKKFAQIVTSRGAPQIDPEAKARRVFRLRGARGEVDEDVRDAHDTGAWINESKVWAPKPFDLEQIRMMDLAEQRAKEQGYTE
jgi:hypothetical protein